MSLRGLAGKTAIVTGAGGGIGSAVARRLSEEGAHVVVVDIDGEAAERTAASLPTDAAAVAADVADERGVSEYTRAAVERFGSVDAVHLNAGYGGRLVALVDSDIDDFDRVIAINVRGVYLGLRAALRRFRDQASGGAVVVTSSGMGLRCGQLFGPYATSKHAVLGLVRSAALEAALDGVRVNAVCPGATDTPMLHTTEVVVGHGNRDAARALIESGVPLGRYARPSEIAALVAWLLSDESSYSTGGYFTADGGIDAAAAGYVPPADAEPGH